MDDQTFLKHLKECETFLRGRAMKLAKNKFDADDLYQNTVIKAFTDKDQLRDQEKFPHWIGRIMLNSFLGSLRGSKIYKNQIDLAHNFEQTALVPLTGDLREDLQLDLENLENLCMQIPPTQAMAFMLLYDGTYSLKEAAEYLEITVGTAKSNKFKAIEKLRPLAKKFLALPDPDP